MSVPEAGKLLGIGRDASYGATRRGEIPVIRIGRRQRVPTSWLLKQLGLDAP
jgi:excisionase family DNA binding protein